MPTSFLDKIKATIKKYNMLQKNDRVLIGVSGGPDSAVLLHVLNMIKKEYGLEIIIAHLDHCFRGEESKMDRKFCEDLAKKYNVEIISDEVNVPKIAEEKGISDEETARLERYAFFRKVALEKHIQKVAVGHTQDDQAETVLMRLVRGAGMAGLGGMSPVKEMKGIQIIRPLIEVTRKEIEDFIKEESLQFRIDSSNERLVFTRNKVRRLLMPMLEKEFNPNIKEVLANTAENLQIENEFLERYAMRKFKSVSKIKKGEIVIDLKRFKKNPEAIRKRILRAALQKLKGDLRRLTYQHWKEIEDLIELRPVNSIVDLPAGISIIKNRISLLFKKVDF